jgi:hypothetical protein
MGGGHGPSSDFWTVPIGKGVAVRSEIAPEIVRQLAEVSAGPGTFEWDLDLKFSWAPSGTERPVLRCDADTNLLLS